MPSSSDELLAVYFPSGEPTGHAWPRSRVHQLGLWHLTTQFWIIRRCPDGSHTLIFQERHPSQQAWPNKLDTTSAGHVRLGETDPLRELEEELGVRPEQRRLHFLGVRRWDDATNPQLVDRELQQTYLWINDKPVGSYELQADEVTALIEVELSEAEGLVSGSRHVASATRYGANGRPEDTKLRKDVLVPDPDGTYLKIIAMGTALIAGESTTGTVTGWLPNPIL